MKRMTLICLISISLTASAASKAPAKSIQLLGISESWVDLAQHNEPSLLDVEQAALHHVGLSDRPEACWKKDARRSALLPRLQVGVEYGYLGRVNVGVQDAVSVASSGVTIGPQTNDMNQASGENTALQVRATWALGELVFHPQELAIDRATRQRQEDRDRLSETVSKLYHERLRLKTLLHIARHDKKAPRMDRIAVRLSYEQASNDLNRLTGGWFEMELKRRRGT